MKVGLITSWPPEICGIGSNSVNVVRHKQPDVEYKIIEGSAWAYPFTHEQVMEESQDCDIVHLSYERNLHAGLKPETFYELKKQGKKTVMTLHNVWPGDHQDDDMVAAFDTVVSQDPKSPEERGWVYVPQGVMQVSTVPDKEVQPKIGTAGFPTFFKGGHIMADVAKELGLGMLVFAPASIHANSPGLTREILARVPNAEIIHEFLPQEVIAERLSECVVTTWLYGAHAGQSGISGSIRLGMAAKRPMVVSRCGMYRDLWTATDEAGNGFEDEFYFVETSSPSFETVLPVVKRALDEMVMGYDGARRPDRVVKYMSWDKCGRLYAEVYRKLMGVGATA